MRARHSWALISLRYLRYMVGSYKLQGFGKLSGSSTCRKGGHGREFLYFRACNDYMGNSLGAQFSEPA